MTGRLIAILCLIFILAPLHVSAVGEEGYRLTIEVEGLRNTEGRIQFALYNKEGSIPDEKYQRTYRIGYAAIIRDKAIFTFEGLIAGKYAVNVLHDENSDGKIDKGLILPIEGIGFTNYRSIGLTNRPNFDKASFELQADMSRTITIIYL